LKASSHTSVLLEELLSLFSSATGLNQKNLNTKALDNQVSSNKAPKRILDCTFGRGGHSLAFLKKYPKSSVLALDRDLVAIQWAKSLNKSSNKTSKKPFKQSRLKVLHKNFYEFPGFADKNLSFDLIIMDLGVSSPQLDEGERGFSFNKPGPLDMRMDQTQKLNAERILNGFSKKELIELFQTYGEIKRPYAVVNDLIQKRKKKRLKTTDEFSALIQKHHSATRYKHPATKWFLALRIAVNQELEGLKNCLPLYIPFLKPGAFLAVISFHSLEDRIVKQSFRGFVAGQKGFLYNKKVIRPSKRERGRNIRSRSAKLRVFQKNMP